MASPKRLDVARTVGELSPAAKEDVADALGVELGSAQFEKAFGNAAKQGLVDPHGAAGEQERWTLSKKGRRRLKAQEVG